MEDGRLAKQLLWGTRPVGAGRPGRRTNPLLPQVYHEHLCSLDLSQSRRDYQKAASNKFGFSWLTACSDRDAWRELKDRTLARCFCLAPTAGGSVHAIKLVH